MSREVLQAKPAPFQPYVLLTSTIKQSPQWWTRVGGDGTAGQDPESWRGRRPARRHPDEPPLAGAYRLRLVRGGVAVPARIWIVEHRDPHEKCLMADVEYHAERGDAAGMVHLGMTPDAALEPPRSVFELWDAIGLEVIPWETYHAMVALQAHAISREQDLAEAQPRRRIDRLTQPTIF